MQHMEIQEPLFDIDWGDAKTNKEQPRQTRKTRRKQTSKVFDACGDEMVRADYETDEYGNVIQGSESFTWAKDEIEADEEESDDWDSPLPPVKKQPRCKPCKVCGKKHWQACHKCPHSGDLAKYKTWEESPCSDCQMGVGGGLKNGHGKCWTFDEVLHGGKYQPPAEIESDKSYESILDALRGFASLTAQEFQAYISVHYFSHTLKYAGKELEEIFYGSYGKNKVMNLLKSAESKLSEVAGASKILRGKILGQD